jgi:hypothetical protein
MSESDPAAVPAPSSSSQPLWRRIAAQFTAHRVTAAFTVILALATLALVVTAYFQHRDAVEAIEATQRLAVATENAANNRRQTASAERGARVQHAERYRSRAVSALFEILRAHSAL